MRLKQIKLSAFKSFADLTVIHVPGQRVAVVGPNGCGKSNVIDAVRWVLGEASAKQLRGQNMQDVIFNGANTRKPLSMASVELVFDNQDHALGGAWGQYAEISIKRSLNRQGESRYQINHQTVRRRDITDLFLGTGVGARGYAVIEQGMISRIIESKPEDLRGFIEEAAGVSKYKERRRETESRLNDAREHLARLGDLRGELDKQIDKLQRQAKTAVRYREIQDELASAQNALDYVLWQSALSEENRLSARRNEIQQQWDQLNAQQGLAQEKYYRQQLAEHDLQEQMQQLAQERAQVREASGRLQEKIHHHQQLRRKMAQEALLAEQEMERIAHRLEVLATEKNANLTACETAQYTLEEYALLREENALGLPELEAEYAQWQSEREIHQNTLSELNQQEALLKQSLDRHQRDKATLLCQLAESAEDAFDLPDISTQIIERDILLDNVQQVADALEDLAQEEQQCLCEYENFQQKQWQWEKEILACESELSAIEKILPQKSPDTPWHSEADFAVLWQHIRVEERWQQAVSCCLGERMHACYAPDFRLPEQLDNVQGIWISQEMPHHQQPSEPFLLNKITTAGDFQAALNVWLNGILCAETLDEAINNQNNLKENQCFITPEGHVIDRVSIALVGKQNHSPIEHHARCETLRATLAQLQSQEIEYQHQSTQYAEQKSALANNIKQQQQQYQTLQNALNQCQRQLDLDEQKIAIQQQKKAHQQTQVAHWQQEIARLSDEECHQQQQLDTIEQKKPSCETLLADAKTQGQICHEKLNRLREQSLQLERQYHQSDVQLRSCQETGRRLIQEEETLQTRRVALMHRQEDIEPEDHSEHEQALAQWQAQDAQIEKQYHELKNTLKESQEILKQLHEEQNTISQRLPETQQQVQAALLSAQEAALVAQNHRQNLIQRGADISQLSSQPHANQETLNHQINQLSQSLHRLGAVNLAAEEELTQLRERHDYYQAQNDDLESAIDQLSEAIAHIDRESKKRFKDTFDEVNRHMQHYFPTLFGGGEARLALTDDDLLSTGIQIIARPPGKKNSSIHLLSGGEKALCAMSLVFALFSLNPAPFCLLDEVDAPLDDANTARFCHLIEQMSEKTQFLYISHNRLTMESAEQLIGVTMQEKGVSRIVSVDIQAALNTL